MNVVRAHPSVQFATIAPAGFRILSAIDQAAQHCGVDLELTSGTDSHQAPDPHASGEAFDVSVRGLTPPQIVNVCASLVSTLGPLFTVLYEVPALPTEPMLRAVAYVNQKATGQHLHIQKRKGLGLFPPTEAGHAA